MQKNFKEEDILFENDNFIDDKSLEGDSTQPSFYRFVNQTRDPREALKCNDQSHVDHRDLQPEKCTSVNLEKMLNLKTLKTVPSYLGNSKRVSACLRIWMTRQGFFPGHYFI